MVKIIHAADLHLGSEIKSKLTREKSEIRRDEIRYSLSRLIERAREEGVKIILLAGDVFDGDRPYKKDKKFFYDAVRHNPDIDFIYLRGNHDCAEESENPYDNLKTFSDEWTYYDYGDITIAGIEMSSGNANSLYASLSLDKAKKNIVLLHGTVGDSSGKDKVCLKKLRGKNIDYLALGHIHSFGGVNVLDERGKWAYSGCLEGRGFDEAGEKGFILLTVGDDINARFTPCARRTIREYDIDITGASGEYEALEKITEKVDASKDDYALVNLSGEVGFDAYELADAARKKLESEGYFAVSVKNHTRGKTDVSAIAEEISLRGEFVRTLMEEDLSDEDRERILSVGLRAIGGKKEF